jgi:cellulose synthase/poly-beta-1,6-N-acetylglucosamine synthase-like glycosyltransferase
MSWLEAIFWLLIVFVLYTYLGYPLLVFLLSRTRRKRQRPGTDYLASVTLIVPAYNEERIIERKVRNCLEIDYPRDRLAVLVVSDGSTDRTVEIAGKYESDGLRVIAFPENRGKNTALNAAMKSVETEISVISDASVVIEKDSVRVLLRNFADGRVGGVWGKKIYMNVRGTAGGEGESIYMKYGNFIRTCESRIGSIVSAEGSLFAFRTKLFEDLPQGVPDDFYLSATIVRKGYRLEYENRARSYEETTPTDEGEFMRKSRIIQQAVKGLYLARDLMNPLRTGFYALELVTAKVFRRLASVALLSIFILSTSLLVINPWYKILFAGELAFLALAFLGWVLPPGKAKSPLFAMPFYLCLVNLAAIHGFVSFFTGRNVARWTPTQRT